MAETKVIRRPKNSINPGTFGAAVIGSSEPQRPTDAQLKAHPELAHLTRVSIVSEEPEIEAEFKEKGGSVFGPMVIGESEPQRPTPAQVRAQPELAKLHGLTAPKAAATPERAPQLSTTKLAEALEDNEFILDTMIAAEFDRPDGPRVGALRILLKTEMKKSEPREDVVARLQASIKEKSTTPETASSA